MNSDVLIIGGGVIGLSIARDLHRAGIDRIAIIDRGEIGREASYAAAGMLAPNAEAETADDFYRFCCDSIALYPEFAEQLFEETGVDIELDRSGTFYLAFSDNDEADLNRRFEWQKASGIDIEYLTAEAIRRMQPNISSDVRSGIFYPSDWQVENRKLLAALKRYAELYSIEIVTESEIGSLIMDGNRTLGAETHNKKYFAGTTILATGAWTSLIKTGETFLPVKVKPIRGQMISFRPAERMFDKVICTPRGYLVPRKDGRILAGATVEDAGFDQRVTDEGGDALRRMALEIAPGLANLEIADKWAGLRPWAPDALPIIGEIADIENLVIATAHFRNGILLAPLTANIVAGNISAAEHLAYPDFLSPDRFRIQRKHSGV